MPWVTAMSGDPIAREATLTDHASAIRALGKRVITDVIEIGRRLTEAKRIAGHGNWLPWLEREFGWSEDTAENYIAVHKRMGSLLNSENSRNLNLPMHSLRILAAKSTPEDQKAVASLIKSNERLGMDVVSAVDVRKEIEAVYRAGLEVGYFKAQPSSDTINGTPLP